MTTLREAAQQALEALENGAIARPGWVPDYDDAIAALRAALVEQDDDLTAAWMAGAAAERKRAEQPQPLTDEEILSVVGWERAEMYMKLAPNFPVDEAKQETLKNARAVEAEVLKRVGVPLYTTPPAPVVPQPLTDEELDVMWRSPMSADWEHREYGRLVEAEVLKRVGVGN